MMKKATISATVRGLFFAAGIVLASALASAQAPGQLIEGAKKGDAAAVKAALAAGAGVNEKGDAGLTALMWASLYGHVPVIDALLSAGAAINEADSEGGTALAYAVLAEHTDAMKLLQSRGGNLGKMQPDNSFDSRMKLFLWTGSRRKDIFDYVTERGNQRKAKADATLQANWSSPLAAPADFRGRWEFDERASDYGQLPKPKRLSFTITQTANELVAEMTLDGKQQVSTYRLDGTEAANVMAANARTLARARWDGPTLVITSRLEFEQIERAAMEEVWSLSPDRGTFTIERHITKPAVSRLRQVMRRQQATAVPAR